MKRRDQFQHEQPGTNTTDGRIPHLRLHSGAHIIEAPVCVRVLRNGRGEEITLRPVVNASGRYVHALPGGATVAGQYKR